MTARDEVLVAARALASNSPDGTFTLSEVVRKVMSSGSRYKESTIRTHVTSRMCINAPDHHAVTYPDLVRTDHGRYRVV